MSSEYSPLVPEYVEQAEVERSRGNTKQAAELAATSLGFPNSLTPSRIVVRPLLNSTEQTAMFACLLRIYVDATKTNINQAYFPHQAMLSAMAAATTLEEYYRDPEVQSALHGVDTDHLGRSHHFFVEMKRDEAKVLEAAAVLFTPEMANAFERRGIAILSSAYSSLEEDHPVRPLIGIEWQLLQASLAGSLDREVVLHNFAQLEATEKDTNPHRVATAASWLAVWGEKLGDDKLKGHGLVTYAEITAKHPEWNYMLLHEFRKQTLERARQRIFRLLTPLMTSTSSRETLAVLLLELNKSPQQSTRK